ncbi:MAG: hypothetical protein AAGK32_16585, partial [Actinomycetota bacterium]
VAGQANTPHLKSAGSRPPSTEADVAAYAEAGANYAAFALPSNDADDVLPRLDTMAALLS